MTINSKIKLNMDALKSNKEWVRHKVKSGHNVFRVLPPFGESAKGYPYRKWQIIWGLSDPESGRMRPYASPMMFEKHCPVMEFVSRLRERLDKMEGDLKASGLDEKSVNKHPKYARLAKFIRDINPKTTYIYNAVDKAGTVGLLELKSSAHKDMKTKMNEYIKDYNQDPTSLNSDPDDSGVWFDVIRTGDGFDTEYKVEKVQAKVRTPNGGIVFQDDRSALPDMVVENFDNLAYDLSSVYRATTYDEVNEILQANLDKFYENCPEADLSVPVSLDDTADATPTRTPVVRASGKTIAPLVDEDDDDVVVKKASPAMSALQDDDFLAQADAILRG